MAIDQKQTWINTINNIRPADSVPAPIRELSDAVDAATTGKAQLTGILGPIRFTFQKGLFFAGLMQLTPAPTPEAGVAKFANSWAQAVTASQMVVSPGASFGTPTPPTIWSAVISTTLDPPSLASAKSYVESELLSAGFNPVAAANNSKIGPALWQAFQMLTYTIVGLDSTPSGSGGPLPLTAPARALM